ncbi:Protein of unknown function [Actinacidiphila guanduensis]|uniref:Uncharacterized protein n=1 Tax=Actinacidiphila guanduensis TaxID=310781 RepID=A0A1H0K957_9ACTN|nr:Protein of unknown function [Actinacidiphila guanduensis]
MGTAQVCLIGAVMLLGLVCVPAPGVPGTLLCWGAVLWWATSEHTSLTWGVLAGATGLLAVTQVVLWLMPNRRIRDSGVDWRTVMTAAGVGIAGLLPAAGPRRPARLQRHPLRQGAQASGQPPLGVGGHPAGHARGGRLGAGGADGLPAGDGGMGVGGRHRLRFQLMILYGRMRISSSLRCAP